MGRHRGPMKPPHPAAAFAQGVLVTLAVGPWVIGVIEFGRMLAR